MSAEALRRVAINGKRNEYEGADGEGDCHDKIHPLHMDRVDFFRYVIGFFILLDQFNFIPENRYDTADHEENNENVEHGVSFDNFTRLIVNGNIGLGERQK